KRIMPATATQNGPVRICVGLPLPSGYTIVAYEKTSACPQGAYVLRKDRAAATNSYRKNDAEASATATTGPIIKTASRPRKVGTEPGNAGVPELIPTDYPSTLPEPKLAGSLLEALNNPSAGTYGPTNLDAKKTDTGGPGDVVRIDTNLVTVPVSVIDRQGRYVADLLPPDFSIFENGVEQKIVHF